MFRCTWDGTEHPSGEIGFEWPDAVFALSLPEDERQRLQEGHNEDTARARDACFVRGWAPLPIQGRSEEWGIGFWIRISTHDFAEFERLERRAHPTYGGCIANQWLHRVPTLGLAAEMSFRGNGLRPLVQFTDPQHPLFVFQRDGVPEEEWRSWLSDVFHREEPAPETPFFDPSLERHGFAFLPASLASIICPGASDLGQDAIRFDRPPRPGDTVKVVIEAVVSDETGDVTTIVVGCWVRIDDVARSDRWSGTLANDTGVPATIAFGTRLWVRPEFVIAHTPAAD